MGFLQRLFTPVCPKCGRRLVREDDPLGSVKACPESHYKEAIFPSLGVTIVYDEGSAFDKKLS